MKKKYFLYIILSVILLFLLFGLFNMYAGWYARKPWKYRVGTSEISESKKRNTFVRELNYKIIDSQNLKNFEFIPYFEKGFKYGFHTSKETNPLKFSKYPYNLSFDRNKKDSIYLDIQNKEAADSSDVVWTYYSEPKLKDTLTIIIDGAKNKNGKEIKGTIKVW